MAARTLAAVCCLSLGLCLITTRARPLDTTRASCQVVWLLALPCLHVHMAIVTEIKGQGSYKLITATPPEIRADHTSADAQVEHVNFTLMPTAVGQGCRVGGSSTSEVWYIPFDNGTNYCNLHSVMQGSGLTDTPGFMEFTNDWLCLGYEISPCNFF